ncbi:MAG: bifunctional transaldolase/phosoglucose isomerase [Anaerolineae bacterium]|nr:bifunctional transaldolase/phosoglucose isomerase [Anaerolineae bacterium]
MSNLHKVADLGQAIWLDFIRRSLMDSGELQALVDEGVRGMTSNPTIFEKAITGSDDYDEELQALVEEGKGVEEIYEALVVADIRRAADILRPIYDATGGLDGFVSLEVSPTLAYKTSETITEAKRLFGLVERPNLMIKVPATPESLPAVEELIGWGVNVNVTLIFSIKQYERVAQAYISGLETALKTGHDLERIASVASFFVSRIDTAVDKALEAAGEHDLQGKVAIASAKVAYARFREIFSGPRWSHLVQYGARVQRPLWASTGTKNPAYPDTWYVDELIGPDTVNTLPPHTLEAFLDHGRVDCAICAIQKDVDQARADLERLAARGIDLDAITDKLLDDGVRAFAESFSALMNSINARRQELLTGWRYQSAKLGEYQKAVDARLEALTRNNFIPRIWSIDHTVWKPSPGEIANRLGWLRSPEAMLNEVYRLNALRESAREDGITQAVLLGMGGSSLAPEVFRRVFGVGEHGLDLTVLDSTDPGAVLALAERLDLKKTLFVVSTKSGTTVETLSFFKFFYNHVSTVMEKGHVGKHFVAITDAGTRLEQLARELDFRVVFLNDPNIGGRYSVFSFFGLVPAGLIDMEVTRLLSHAMTMAQSEEAIFNCKENPGAWLGGVMGELARAGRDKLTFILSPPLAAFGDWVEQLVAESLGKEGKGILPVVGEPPGKPDVYGDDRLFVYMQLYGDTTHDAAVEALEAAGQPVVRLDVQDLYALGRLFFMWEMATAAAGAVLDVNPFDQPNVEAAKKLTRKLVAAYTESGKLPGEAPALSDGEITVYGGASGASAVAALDTFVAPAKPGDYVALQAYIQPTPLTDAVLKELRTNLRDRLKLATTVGYGPRFLHSTGQLHKGDAGNGLFIQFTADDPQDAPIPDEPGSPGAAVSFGVLKHAQALGDAQALREAGRRVIRFHLGEDVVGNLQKLADAME